MLSRDGFHDRIRAFSAARRGVLNAALGWRLGTLALLAATAGLLLLGGWLPNAFVNAGLSLALVLFVTGLAVAFALRRRRFDSPLGEAFHMEALAGGLNSRLVSAFDFLERDVRDPFTNAVVARAEADLAFAFESQIDRSERDRRRRRFAVPLAAFVLLGLTPWFSFGRVAANIRDSWLAVHDALFPVEYRLTPPPGRHIHRLGESVALSLEFTRRGHDRVTLVREVEGAGPERIELAVDASGRANHTLSADVEETQIVRFEFGERRTPDSTFIFTVPPTLVNMQTELVPPAYTRLLPKTLEGVQPRLPGLPGTRMSLGFTLSKDLESAALAFDDGQTLPLDVVGRFASTSLVHSRARQATLQAIDLHGFSPDATVVIDFDVQADEKPVVYLPRHLTDDMPLLAEGAKLFGFGARAEDDFGITRCVLKWQKSTTDNPMAIADQGEIERLISPPQRKAAVSFERAFESFPLSPGDRISFTVDVYDNRAPDRQMTRSRRCSFFIFQEDLGGLNIAQLGFGAGLTKGERIPKAQRQTAVKAPEGLRPRELVRNEFEADVQSSVQSPLVRGEYGRATRDYFRLLSTAGAARGATETESDPAPKGADR